MPPSRSEVSPDPPLLVASAAGGGQVPDLSQDPPLVSVIIPVLNRAKSLAVALRSLAEQTFPDWEAVVVDDGSSDESAEVALRAGPPGKVRLVRHQRNQGPSAARNSGILAARGRYVSFLDSDDSWHPEKLSRQLELVQADSNPNMVFCVTQTRILGRERGDAYCRSEPPFPTNPGPSFFT